MKQTFAAVVTAVTAGTSIWLAGAEAATGATARSKPPAAPSATLRIVPKWTYQQGGKIAVIVACSQRADLRVVSSKLLPRPVTLPKSGNLLIKVTNKTRPMKYAIMLSCMGKNKQIDSVDRKPVRILKRLGGFYQPDPPPLPKHFKPAVTVSSGPPAPVRHRKK